MNIGKILKTKINLNFRLNINFFRQNVSKDKIFTTLMPTSNVNSLCLYPHSGVVFAACDEQRAQAFFVPALGVAPKWCAFLDSITEELEEEKNDSVYEDFKFVTCADLKELGFYLSYILILDFGL